MLRLNLNNHIFFEVHMKTRNILSKIMIMAFLALMVSAGFASPAVAQFPERQVTLLVGYAAGGSLDLSARALARSAEKILGQSVVVENKPGASGTVALATMLARKPDGYTLCAASSASLLRASQLHEVPFKAFTSFRTVIGYTEPLLAIAVRNDAPWKTLADLVADIRKNPGKIKYASPGAGSTQHTTVMEIVLKDQLQAIHVPYKGSIEAATAVLGGHADFAALTSEFVPMVRAGQARLLAVASEKRLSAYPNVPTLIELGYDFSNDAVFVIVARADMDAAAGKKIDGAFRAAAKDKEYLDALDRISMLPAYYEDKAFDAFMRKHWKRINTQLKAAGLIQEAATPPE